VNELDLVVFDMDGVLTDSTPSHARAYQDLWTELGITGPAYEDISGWRTAEAVLAHTRQLRPTAAQLAQWTRFKQVRARAYLEEAPTVFPDVTPTLERLRRRGLRFAVGTGASRETANALLGRAGLLRWFTAIVTADDVARGKPAPDTFQAAVSAAGATAGRSLVIEDSTAGLVAGAAAGTRTASVRSGVRIDSPAFLGAFPDLETLGAVLEDGTGS
jgi:HAD superfamily hydrolase (TIGR01509 family)